MKYLNEYKIFENIQTDIDDIKMILSDLEFDKFEVMVVARGLKSSGILIVIEKIDETEEIGYDGKKLKCQFTWSEIDANINQLMDSIIGDYYEYVVDISDGGDYKLGVTSLKELHKSRHFNINTTKIRQVRIFLSKIE